MGWVLSSVLNMRASDAPHLRWKGPEALVGLWVWKEVCEEDGILKIQ
jgi:hypothetical protein